MDDAGRRGGPRSKAAEELVLRTIATHADSLLRTARRNSLCFDDAQDAYQRGLEIFMLHADRLDAGRAGAWLHTVVKHEAIALRRSRQRLVGAEEADLDAHQERRLPTPDEQLLSFDLVSRSAEALQRLKPQELRALWLKAQGHSYNDIGEITGWSYTKVNRCLTEGRRNFLERYAGIEVGDECRRWAPVISAMVDGEATPEQMLDLRPHLRNCPGCRATLKALQDSTRPLAAVLPVPLIAAASGGSDWLSSVLLRAYEAVAGGLHERAVTTVTKAQVALEASAAGKVAAVAASAAAVAGGGYATVERVGHPPESRPAATSTETSSASAPAAVPTPDPAPPPVPVPSADPGGAQAADPAPVPARDEFGSPPPPPPPRPAPEFAPADTGREFAPGASAAPASADAGSPPPPAPSGRPAPEFAPSGGGGEFGP